MAVAANPRPYPCMGGGLLAVAVKRTLPLQGGGPLATGGASYMYILQGACNSGETTMKFPKQN